MPAIDRKSQILASALEMFLQKGFANVSTRDVTRHAGLSNSHLYHYFGDWECLRREAFLRFANLQLEQIIALTRSGSPADALRSFLRECLPATADPVWRLWFDVWDEAMHDAALAATYREINTNWHEALGRLIERGLAGGDFRCRSTERAGRQIFALTMGYADELLLSPSDAAAQRAFSEVWELVSMVLGMPVAPCDA
ncbi:TetR family transcriptional regulator [Massilia sp. CCM 8733]|uniref:TetR family transcriptional regulator n=1 Tax=Massilia mucilaginosa TaxID=2609282 RepID=A0ABX0NM48_9BURK|nr:TetR family transcriptional regulator C-terminal domain-containing protein [Massilia mucilaginosa]NHZ87848.1 TetR family transcriptional regulator [Massilia mucilaginosa]